MIKKDFLKYKKNVVMFYIFVFLVVAYYFSEMVNYILQKTRTEDFPIIGDQFTLSMAISVVVVGAGIAYAWTSSKINSAVFETANELAHVDWPDAEETKNSTMVTIVFSVLFSLMLAVMDLVWAFITSFLV